MYDFLQFVFNNYQWNMRIVKKSKVLSPLLCHFSHSEFYLVLNQVIMFHGIDIGLADMTFAAFV